MEGPLAETEPAIWKRGEGGMSQRRRQACFIVGSTRSKNTRIRVLSPASTRADDCAPPCRPPYLATMPLEASGNPKPLWGAPQSAPHKRPEQSRNIRQPRTRVCHRLGIRRQETEAEHVHLRPASDTPGEPRKRAVQNSVTTKSRWSSAQHLRHSSSHPPPKKCR